MVRPDYDLTITTTTTPPSYEIETGTIWSLSATNRRNESQQETLTRRYYGECGATSITV